MDVFVNEKSQNFIKCKKCECILGNKPKSGMGVITLQITLINQSKINKTFKSKSKTSIDFLKIKSELLRMLLSVVLSILERSL